MEAFALYLTKSTVWLTGFALVYLLFLRNERFFLLNRIFLVTGIVVSIVFPLFTLHYTVMVPAAPTVEVSELQMMGPVDISEPFPTQAILLSIYLVGALYLLTRITRQTLAVIKVIRKSEIHPYRSAKLIRTTDYPSSFSFFSFVFVNPSTCDTETNEIVNHEMEHIRQKHWMDLLLFECLCTLQWFNPLSWLYGRFIRQNHEYLADERALQRCSHPGIYRAALLNQMFGGPVISLANSFNYSLNKKRFQMMTQTIYSPIRKLKLLIVLPLIAGVFYAFATPEYTYAPSAQEELLTIMDTRTIKGKVVNEEGVPLKGASVVISEKTIGTITDNDGNFVLQMTDDSPLVISYVGYESQKVTPSSVIPSFDQKMMISLKKVTIGVDEVRVIASGDNASLAELEFDKAMILVNGIEIPKFAVANLDPDLIKSVNVVTGKSAISKYGDKGNNGVVEITLNEETFTEKNIGRKGNNINIKISGYSKDDNDGITLNPNTQFKQIKFKGMNVFKNEPEPLIVLDGVITENSKVETIDPETFEAINVLKGESATKKYGDKGKNGVVEITIKKDAKVQKADDVYTVVEQMPEFPGGDAALRKFIATSVKYPATAAQNGIQGKVYVAFVVTKTGSVANARVVRGVDPLLDQEALRVVNLLPTWTPGKQGGEYVDVEYTVPINFALQGAKTIGSKTADGQAYLIVEEMPEFPGGSEALRQFIASNVKYPALAHQNGIQGKVYINFVVTKTGSIANAKVARGVDPSLDQEALRVVNLLPTWLPGKQGGKNVDVSYTVPINFALNNDNTSNGKPVETNITGYNHRADVMPVFSGGNKNIQPFIAANINYPAIALEKGIYGKVDVELVITKTGSIENARVFRSIDQSLDQEAIRVIKSMPTWEPAKNKGENVDVKVFIPVKFELPTNKISNEKLKTKASAINVGELNQAIEPTVQKKKLIIVPNPTQNMATVTLDGSDSTNKLEVSIFNSHGTLISKESKNGPSFSLSVANLAAGTYVVVAIDGTTQYQGQMVVNH